MEILDIGGDDHEHDHGVHGTAESVTDGHDHRRRRRRSINSAVRGHDGSRVGLVRHKRDDHDHDHDHDHDVDVAKAVSISASLSYSCVWPYVYM